MAFQAAALCCGNAPAFVPSAGTEPSGAEGGPASSLTIGRHPRAPAVRCWSPPRHTDGLSARSHVSLPEVEKGAQIPVQLALA